MKLDLNAPGESFYLSLERYIGRIKHKVDRNEHYVRFSTDKVDTSAESCVVYLSEREVRQDWDEAVEWIRATTGNASRPLYAIVEQDDIG